MSSTKKTVAAGISIIVPVHNEERFIDGFIGSLFHSGLKDYPEFEVILVNDASDDSSLPLLKEWQNESPQIKVISNKRQKGPAAARNLGLQHASGGVIVFVDADCMVENNWLSTVKKIAEDLKHSGIAGVGGPILPLFEPKSAFQRMIARFPMHRPRADRLGNYIDLPAGNVVFRREVLEEVHCFDQRLFYGEDSDLCHRILKNGHQLSFNQGLKIYHQVPENFWWLLKGQFHYGKSFAGHLKKTGNFSWIPVFGHLFWESLPWYLGLTCLPVSLFFLPGWLKLIVFTPYLLTFYFSAQFLRKKKITPAGLPLQQMALAVLIQQVKQCSYQLGYLSGGLNGKG